MSASLSQWLRSLAIAVPVTAASAMLVTPSVAQNAAPKNPPPASNDTKDTAKDTAKDAKDTAKDTAKDAKDTAKDAKDTARDTAKDVRDSAKDTRDTAKDTAKDARDSAKDTRDTAKDTAKDARDTARDTQRDARDTQRDPRDTARDPGSRDKVRDPRDPRDPGRDQSRDARDPENLRNPNRDDRDRRDDRDTRRDDRDDRGIGASASFSAQGTRAADIGIWFERDTSKGLVISDVASKGAIAKLGFRAGDRIVSVAGHKVTREDDFITYLFDEEYRNERIKVIVIRDGREEVIFVEPAIFVEELSYVENDPLENFGIIVDDRYDDRIVVWRVVPRSPAYYAGIRAGDVILTFNNQRLANIAAFVQRLTGADPGEVEVQVNRGDRTRTLHVDVPRFVNRTERRTTLRPNFDNARERRDDRLDRREDRIEDRRDRREDRRDEAVPAPRVPNVPAPGVAPTPGVAPAPATPPAAAPRPSTPAPAPGAPAPRPGLFPRGRDR